MHTAELVDEEGSWAPEGAWRSPGLWRAGYSRELVLPKVCNGTSDFPDPLEHSAQPARRVHCSAFRSFSHIRGSCWRKIKLSGGRLGQLGLKVAPRTKPIAGWHSEVSRQTEEPAGRQSLPFISSYPCAQGFQETLCCSLLKCEWTARSQELFEEAWNMN